MPRSLLCALLFAAIPAMANPAFAWMTPPAFNTANGHYYAFFTTMDGVKWDYSNMSFDVALARAASMSHLGIPGHLVTITSQAEQDYLYERFLHHAGRTSHQEPFDVWELFWIAASDAAVEDDWRWVAGPEAGQMFWQGNYQGEAFGYHNWGLSEPNDLRGITSPYDPAGEDVATIRFNVGATGEWWQTFWNDVSAIAFDGSPSPSFVPRLGIVEFSPVPEPSSGALIASAGVMLLSARRPRRYVNAPQDVSAAR